MSNRQILTNESNLNDFHLRFTGIVESDKVKG